MQDALLHLLGFVAKRTGGHGFCGFLALRQSGPVGVQPHKSVVPDNRELSGWSCLRQSGPVGVQPHKKYLFTSSASMPASIWPRWGSATQKSGSRQSGPVGVQPRKNAFLKLGNSAVFVVRVSLAPTGFSRTRSTSALDGLVSWLGL